MSCKSLYFLPAWQKAKRNPNGYWVNTALFIGYFYCPSRCGHNAVCVNEDLIVWGGYSDDEVGDSTYCENHALWVYNMDNDMWFSVETTGSTPLCRSGAVSVLVWPYWYIIAGHTHYGDTNDVHALNLITLKWEKVSYTGPGLSSRDKASGWFWENRIYVFGGYGPQPQHDLWMHGEDVFTLELSTYRGWNNQLVYFDLVTKQWVRPIYEGHKPLSRAAHSTTLVGNSVYLFGGRHKSERLNDLHCLDLESGKWSGQIMCLGEIPCGRSWHTMSKAGGSNLLLFGGYSNGEVPLDDSWLLNINTFSWTLLIKETGFPRTWHTANVNSHGEIMVFGGCVSNILHNDEIIETSDKVIVFKTQPFSLQRMCLHTLFNHRKETEHLWDELPTHFQEWLCDRLLFSCEMSPDYYESTAQLAFGPPLSHLSVMSSEEASQRNKARKELENDFYDSESEESSSSCYES